MRKENLVTMILGIFSIIPFALGMKMILMTEWDLLVPGIVVGAIGLLILILIIPIHRKITRKTPITLSKKTIISTLIGIVGTIGLGVGLSMVLVTEDVAANPGKIILAIAIGSVGIVLCIINYPISKMLENKRRY